MKEAVKEVIFATNNAHKVREVAAEISGIKVLTLADVGLSGDIPETSPTLQGNAAQKARWVFERTDGSMDVFADDTGLEIDALDGEPGVFSARYSGGGAEQNIDKVLEKLQGSSNRSAQFRTVICLKKGGSGDELFFQGVVRGEILNARTGADGFGYDPIFSPEGSDLSFAEMDLAQKNLISHRGRAVRALCDYYKNI